MLNKKPKNKIVGAFAPKIMGTLDDIIRDKDEDMTPENIAAYEKWNANYEEEKAGWESQLLVWVSPVFLHTSLFNANLCYRS